MRRIGAVVRAYEKDAGSTGGGNRSPGGQDNRIRFAQISDAIAAQTGWYTGKLFQGPILSKSAVDLTAAVLGTLPTADDLTIINPGEVSQSGALSEDQVVAVMLVGAVDRNARALAIVLGGGGGESIGLRQGQLHQMTSDNAGGWDLLRFATV